MVFSIVHNPLVTLVLVYLAKYTLLELKIGADFAPRVHHNIQHNTRRGLQISHTTHDGSLA